MSQTKTMRGPDGRPYVTIPATELHAGDILIDTRTRVTGIQVTASGYVLITTEDRSIPHMSRGHALWRVSARPTNAEHNDMQTWEWQTHVNSGGCPVCRPFTFAGKLS